jgi:hypothetical protein
MRWMVAGSWSSKSSWVTRGRGGGTMGVGGSDRSGKDIQAGFGRSPGMPRCAARWDRRAGGHHQMPAVSARAHWVDVRADPSPAERVGGREGYEASSNQSSPRSGSRAGANVVGVHGSPSAASTARARAESTTTASMLRRPPHGHDSTSMAKHPTQQLGPRDPTGTRRAARRRRGRRWFAATRGHRRAELRPPLAGGAEHPRVAHQVATGWRDPLIKLRMPRDHLVTGSGCACRSIR